MSNHFEYIQEGILPTGVEIKKHLVRIGMSADRVEKLLGMPQSTISKATSKRGDRRLPAKWVRPFFELGVGGVRAQSIVDMTMEELGGSLPRQFIVLCERMGKTPSEMVLWMEELISLNKHKRLRPDQVVPKWVDVMDRFCEENKCTPVEIMDCYVQNKRDIKRPKVTIGGLLPGR